MLRIDQWILSFRSSDLNLFFSYFPFLASDYFYMSLIATQYWIGSNKKKPIFLTVLIAYTTLINCLLKNLFQIPRPSTVLHLIPVYDPFGFPSGDVQVAVVFWGYLAAQTKGYLRFLFFIPILAIGLSRIYLGVHTFYDVIGAIVFGFFMLFLFVRYWEPLFFESPLRYWAVIVITTILFLSVSGQLSIPPMASIALGVLIGIGCLKPFVLCFNHQIKIYRSLGYLFLILCLFVQIPVLKFHPLVLHLSISMKFILVVFSIFYFFPQMDKKFFFPSSQRKMVFQSRF